MTNAQCHVCGNEYDRSLAIRTPEGTRTYDCFECAIHDLAPTCSSCDVKIVGHGVQAGDKIFCSAHCAGREGVDELQDRA